MKIKEYILVSNCFSDILTQEINSKIKNGFEILGNTYYSECKGCHFQAMVKYEEETIKPEVKESKVEDLFIGSEYLYDVLQEKWEKEFESELISKQAIDKIDTILNDMPAVIVFEKNDQKNINLVINVISRIQEEIEIFKAIDSTSFHTSFFLYKNNLKPFLDWQENRPDNKPREGVDIIIKVLEENDAIVYCDAVYSNEMFQDDHYAFCCDLVKQWAYIPE